VFESVNSLRGGLYDIFVLRFQPKKHQFLVALPMP